MEAVVLSEVSLEGIEAADIGTTGGPAEVSALCFHPSLPLITLAATRGQGTEVLQADVLSGEVLLRMRTRRQVSILRHLELGGDSVLLVVAFGQGDIEVWDCETMELRERFAPSKRVLKCPDPSALKQLPAVSALLTPSG